MTEGLPSAEGNLSHKLPGRHCRGSKLCQVPGCLQNLQSLDKSYCLKKRLCPKHMKADAVKCEGCGEQLFRYCQQCGKLEVLSKFQGTRRSCRISLNRRHTRAGEDEQHPRCRQARHPANPQEQQQQLQEQRPADPAHSISTCSTTLASGAGLDSWAITNASNKYSSHSWAPTLAEACPIGCIYSSGYSAMQVAASAPHSPTDMQEGYLDSMVRQEINTVLAAGAGTSNAGMLSDKQQELVLEMVIEEELLAAAAMVSAGVVNEPDVLPQHQHDPAVQFAQTAVLPPQQQLLLQQQQALGYGMTAMAANHMATPATAPAVMADVPAASFALQAQGHPRANSTARLTIKLQSLKAQLEQLQQLVTAIDAMQQQETLHRMHSNAYSAGSNAYSAGSAVCAVPWQFC